MIVFPEVGINQRALHTSDRQISNNNQWWDQIPCKEERETFKNQNIQLTWNNYHNDYIFAENLTQERKQTPLMLGSQAATNNRYQADLTLKTTQEIINNAKPTTHRFFV